ncbi:uncharacterized protein TRUGW13939_07994 [Talaromyces rugulosus]|uniref:Trafficking protein particle complex subunit n=1 Tax=Talaromyces rugulosus TaxID=121627 RepID=A0A7H8R4C6_TALRU|nr:uncharacterized protein TRUGW13939_07994 [Talaromyces rugulosus]QKX60848.1 hypothetical protein TRUGW13939_07994 [Talaromyces rugulosus]
MTVYAFYIFDRHGIFLSSFLSVCPSVSLTSARLAECIYKRRWLSRPTSDTQNLNPAETARRADDDAKLVFGTVFSLRNMVRKLGGEDDSFISYRTTQYKLHFYESPTSIKFVMLTDDKAPSMRIALQQIYVNLFVEYVVKNPLSPVEHPGGLGVNNELFEESLEQFVVCPSIERTRVLS